MLILPSVGSKVTRIILNKNATKAKIYFSDGSTAIVCTSDTSSKESVSVTESVKPKKTVKKKILEHKKPIVTIKKVNTSSGMINVPEIKDKSLFESQRLAAIDRAKKKAEMLEEQNMSASERMGISAQEGEIVG